MQEDGQHLGGLQFPRTGAAYLLRAPWEDMFDQGMQRRFFFRLFGDHLTPSQDHHRAIVDRMMEGGARQDQPVHMGDGNADRQTALHPLEQSAAWGTVQIELRSDPHIQGRDDKRLIILHQADMAEKARIQNGRDRLSIIHRALRGTPYPGA